MYTTINGTSYISGDFGKYDKKIKDNSVRYGRNSVDNFKKYLSNYTQPNVDLKYDCVEFSHKKGAFSKLSDYIKTIKLSKQMDKLEKSVKKMEENETKRTPLEFVQKYMPGRIENGVIDKNALLGAAYEELGATEQSLEELNKKAYDFEGVSEDMKMTSDALDINEDGKVDIAEYATSILLEDALSADTDDLRHENINGVITKDGSNKSLPYYTKGNVKIARNVFNQIYNYYNLGQAKQEFLKDKNNTAKA